MVGLLFSPVNLKPQLGQKTALSLTLAPQLGQNLDLLPLSSLTVSLLLLPALSSGPKITSSGASSTGSSKGSSTTTSAVTVSTGTCETTSTGTVSTGSLSMTSFSSGISTLVSFITSLAFVRSAPQLEQNFASVTSFPQSGQITILTPYNPLFITI